MADWRALGNAIKERREELDLSQPELAAAAGMGYSTLQGYELGRPRAGLPKSLKKLERALQWEPGSAKRVLEGGAPTLTPLPPAKHTQPVDADRLSEVLEVAFLPDGSVDPDIAAIATSGLPRDRKIELIRAHLSRLDDAKRQTRRALEQAEVDA